MSVFEANIQTLEQLLHSASPAPINTQRFVAAPKNAHAGLVLKSDMCAEFGAPQAMSHVFRFTATPYLSAGITPG